jgi:transposase
MKVFGLAIPNGVSSIHPIELSKKARLRLAWMAWYNEHGRSGRLTCRHYGIGPATFYLWKGRFDEHGPGALEDGSRRPRRLRTPTWTPQLERAVLDLRRMAPRWGKDKLAVLLRQEGWAVSTSMVGRILTKLRSEGRFSAAPLNDPWRRPVRFPPPLRGPQAQRLSGRGPRSHRPGRHRSCSALRWLPLQTLHRLRRLQPLAGPGGPWPRHGSRRGRLPGYDP